MDNIATDIDTSNNNVQSIAVYANTNADLGLKTVSWRLSNESSEVLSESFDLALDDDSDTLIPATFEILYSPAAVAGEALKGAVAALKNSITVIDNALNSPFSKITQFIGDLYSNLKAIYEDLKEHNWSGLLFDCLGSFAEPINKRVHHNFTCPKFNPDTFAAEHINMLRHMTRKIKAVGKFNNFTFGLNRNF